MLKRRYGDRSEWKRLLDKEYTQALIDTEGFKGYVTLIKVNKVTEPLYVKYKDQKICIVNDGYIWLQHFPTNEQHSLTTMFDSNGEVVQWYIDICERNGVENKIPWVDDLFIDIVVLPDGEIIRLDEDELEEALLNGTISNELHEIACTETKRLQELIENGKFTLMGLTRIHKDELMKQLERIDGKISLNEGSKF